MNRYKFFADKKELWLEIPKPETGNYKDVHKWYNRLHYPVSPELDLLLEDGALLNENEFTFYEESSRVGLHGGDCDVTLIAIPLSEAKTDVKGDIANILLENITVSGQLGGYVIHGAIEKIIQYFEQTIKPQEEPERAVKPPVGLMPRWRFTELRIDEIDAAIDRYNEMNYAIPVEWNRERFEHIQWLKKYLPTSPYISKTNEQ